MYYNNENKTIKKIVIYIVLGIVILSLFFIYKNIKQRNNLKKYNEYLASQAINYSENLKKIDDNQNSLPDISTPKTWLSVQKKVKNTVVQVFTMVDEFNWIEPYKTPKQTGNAGSGFFIDDKGYFVTNYHVVAQANSVKIQIPAFGRKQFEVEIVGVCPDKDVALLKLTKNSFDEIKKELGQISYLELGNSDIVLRTQEVLALGYPLGQERLKSTLGIVSGRESAGFLQITAPLNPGNSGGPTIDSEGKVVGINFAIISGAQNVGYIIPVNEIKSALKDMRKVKLLRKPVLGCMFTVATSEIVKYLNNPEPGGWYIAQVFDNTVLNSIGVKENDMLYEVNGYKLDLYGEMSVPWSEDKISILDFLNRFTIGDDIYFVIYRNGVRKDFNFKLNDKYLPPVRTIYSEFESDLIDYEVFGGLVVMPLTLNHVSIFAKDNMFLANYIKPEKQHEPALIITHILPNSQAQKSRVLAQGLILAEINGKEVKTLKDFRDIISKSKKDDFVTIKTVDKMFAVLSVEKILQDEDSLSSRYFYKKSDLIKKIYEN